LQQKLERIFLKKTANDLVLLAQQNMLCTILAYPTKSNTLLAQRNTRTQDCMFCLSVSLSSAAFNYLGSN